VTTRALAAAAPLFVLLVSTVAGAQPVPRLDALPSATLPAPPGPRDAPKSLPARSVAEGLIVTREPGQPFGVVVTPAPSGQGGCLSVGPQSDLSVVSSSGVRWMTVRRQWIAIDEGGPRLVAVDAWIDARSLASREAARYEAPLQTLATGPGALKVYGFRDGAVLRAFVPLDLGGSVQTARGEAHLVTCRIASVVLDTATPGGEVAVVIGETEVPVAPLATKTKRRAFHISLSASRTASDEAPVLSAAVAWADGIHLAVPAAPIVGD
jgi:hypothetical protein